MKSTKLIDATLIGLTVEEAYEKIKAAGLQTNLEKNEKTGEVQATKMVRIMLLMPNYITVEYNKQKIVIATRRG